MRLTAEPRTGLAAVVDDRGDDLLRLAYHLTGDADRAAELLRSALAAWSVGRHDKDPEQVLIRRSLSPWQAWSALRSGARPESARELIVEVGHEQLDERTLVIGAFQQLTPRDRAVIALRVFEGWSPGPVVQAVGDADLDAALATLAVRLGDVESADPGGVEARLRRAFRRPPTLHEELRTDLVEGTDARALRMVWFRRAGVVALVAAVIAAAFVVPGLVRSLVPDSAAATAAEAVEPPPPPPTFAPIDLPRGGSPDVVYAENAFDVGGGFLRDGEVKVPIDRGWRHVPFGRVPNGWLIVAAESHDFADGQPHHGGVGIYTRDGDWRRLGDAAEWNAALSPDGTQAAFLTPGPQITGNQLVVVDIATGRRIATRPAVSVLGWNSDGIWFRTRSTWVWRPGSAPRPVRDEGLLQIHRRTSWVTQNVDGCIGPAVLRSDGRLASGQRHCGDGLLAPDGRFVAAPKTATAAIAPTGLSIDWVDGTTWEDDTHVLVHASGGDGPSAREVILRCDIGGDSCETAYDSVGDSSPPAPRLSIHEP